MLSATVYVTLKSGVLDPQGEAVKHALHALGYPEVRELRLGKFMQLTLEGENRAQLEKRVDEMCRKLLANPVIENFKFEVKEGKPL